MSGSGVRNILTGRVLCDHPFVKKIHSHVSTLSRNELMVNVMAVLVMGSVLFLM